MITLKHTALGRTPQEEWSAQCRGLSDNTQHAQTAPGSIWTRKPSKNATADPRITPRDHWDQPIPC